MALFEAALATVRAMALEYRDLLVRTSGIGHNHGPSESDFDPAVFERLNVLPSLLTAAWSRLDRDHHAAWRAYVDDATLRLRTLAESDDSARKWAIWALERWQQWAAGESVPDAAAEFATTIEVLTDNERTIDALLDAKK
jgi:hypothetical protein